jgi:hypothetical protein
MEFTMESQWTPELVLEHTKELLSLRDKRYQERFDAQEKAIQQAVTSQERAIAAAMMAAEKALDIAERNSEKWKNNADEWRATMTNREHTFATKIEYDVIKERADKLEGTSLGHREVMGWLFTIIAIVISLAAYLVTAPGKDIEQVIRNTAVAQ